MKFSDQWLREWVDPEVPTAALAEALTLAGLEVAGVTPVASRFSGVEVGEIRAIETHPEDPGLRVCSVFDREGDAYTVVCGAPNARAGLRVAWARVGATLPGGRVIGRVAFGDVASAGMLCSAEELGLEDTSDGVMELPLDSPLGADVWHLLGLDDQAIEVDLTPNRGDCLGIAGIAREIGVLFRRPVTPPAVRPVAAVIPDVLEVRVLAPAACPSYVGRIVRGLDARAHTPLWVRERLRRAGVRCLGPIVDVTNYVMLEWGQPMHAFDLARLGAPIEVRHAREGERITLLDGQELALTGETLVIADRTRAVAVAGIMGGHDAGVGPNTTDVFLESAFFAPAAVAGKARVYRLQTDSSHRFERGVDFEIQDRAIERATALLIAICGGRPGPVVSKRAPEHLPARNAITLRASRMRRLLGVDVPAQEVAEVLSRLGMSVAAEPGASGLAASEAGAWRVQPPSFRFDLAIEADLIEELARVRGYERIPGRSPLGALKMSPRPEAVLDTARLRQVLCDRGYHEAITYSFVDPVNLGRLMPGVETLQLANPIASDMSVMRPSLWPGLLGALKRNQDRQVARVRLFEIGLVFRLADGKLDQCPKIGGVAWGPCVPEQWSEPRRAVDFFDVKNDVEALLALAGADGGAVEFQLHTDPALHPHQSALVLRAGREVGVIGALHPLTARALGLQTPVYVFELDLGPLCQRELPVYRPLSRFPLVRRDLSLVVARDTPAGAVLECIAGQASEVLQEARLFDLYCGEGLDAAEKSIAIGLIFQGISSTLIDEEVDAFVERVLIRLQETLGARQRGQRSSD
ncbi:MAG: phenylalanine--tRNA ligase subunit beta [Pseudomonadota bacterium]|nr:phenylalanine--tRNA ligase subunit beta [Gammaproteobacteria bacterium]MDQ3582645.1 phenylalanine--tRNA ligase subunit beta [Pseudomonadota bacterium]